MGKLTNAQKNDELVKSLLHSGFSEDIISEWIDDGDITIKSIGEDDDFEDDEPARSRKAITSEDVEVDVDDDDDEDDDVEVDVDGDEDADDEEPAKSKKKSKKSCGKGRVEKSFYEQNIFKSLDVSLDRNRDDIVKAITPLFDSFEKSFRRLGEALNDLQKSIAAIGSSAPAFKSEALSQAYIQKSLERGGGVKDADNKTVLSVTRDRQVVRELIAKSIDEEPDTEVQKSLRENTTSYLLDPVMGAVGEYAARYFYDKKNVRLVQ